MKKRWISIGAIATIAIILLTLFAAPTGGNKIASGSTYSRAPNGYGAWYAFMENRGTPVKRWQKPIDWLPRTGYPMTLLRVNSALEKKQLGIPERVWVEQGNHLVILGVRTPVTEASFTTFHKSAVGAVKIETGRRQELSQDEVERLSDRFGAIVWQQKLGKGQVIFATTPHLAANAYQAQRGNFEFLASLISLTAEENYPITNDQLPIKNSIWVDEYIHGYQDREAIAGKYGKDSITNSGKKSSLFGWTYFGNTPLFPLLVQAGVILLVLVLAKNRRLGPSVSIPAQVVDNSKAYIQALAGVLQKAESRDFIIEVIGKEEQRQLQQTLGLGSVLLDPKTVIAAWVQQTGRPATELQQVLQLQSKKRQIGEQDLLIWLEQWQKIWQQLTVDS